MAGASLLAAVYFTFPDRHLVLWTPLGLSAVGAALVGVRLNRPANRAAWYLFAAAMACFVAGDTIYNVQTDLLHQDNPFPSVADVFYLAMYPLIGAGLFVLIRARTISRDPAALIDAVTIATGLGLLSWVYLILPYFQRPGLSLVERATSIAYPLGDVLVLAMLSRLIGGGARIRALQMLTIGGAGLLAADVMYGWIQLNGTWNVGGPVDAGWVVFYVAWGAAALHPSMSKVDEQSTATGKALRFPQVVVLTVASLIAPGVLFGEAVTRSGNHAGTIAVFSAALYLLVITRLYGIVRVHRESVIRERALRTCWGGLAVAEDPEQVYAVTMTAIQALTASVRNTQTAIVSPEMGQSRLLAGWVEDFASYDQRRHVAESAAGLHSRGRLSISHIERDGMQPALLVAHSTSSELGWEIHQSLLTLASQVSSALERIRLRAHDARFKQLIQNAFDIIMVVDGDCAVQYASPSLERRLGWDIEALRGLSFERLVHEEDVGSALTTLSTVASTEAGQHVTDWRLRYAKDGSHGSFEVVLSNLLGDPLIAGVVLTMRDVSERRELEGQLAHQAFHDALTGLANRSLFNERSAHALARATSRGTTVALLMLDLDEFKVVNDTLGHAAGDELLVGVAGRLTESARSGATVARLGGDEFAVLLEDVADPADVLAAADEVLRQFQDAFSVAGDSLRVGASVGLVVTGADSRPVPLADLLRQADLALYAAKDAGRGVVVPYHDDLSVRMQDLASSATDLRRAVDAGEFTLVYQPIVDVEDGQAIGAEALLRWLHPERGLLGPGEVITVAERSGLITEIGGWVLIEACRQWAVWERCGADLRMSVNVSGLQLERPAFIDEVAAAIEEHGLPPGRLLLEITESVLVRDKREVLERLHQLRACGARIAIDDFGVGYSSLSYLKNFPIDTIKIDKSFVDDLGSGQPRGGDLARAVVSFGTALQLDVVAEGIERVEQRDELIDLGCRLGQGYLYSRPIPPVDFSKIVASGALLGPARPRGDAGSARAGSGVPTPRPNPESSVLR